MEKLVRIEDCDYIVSGIIEYYKNEELIATINFGDGECDEFATKTCNGVTTEFSMSNFEGWQ